MDTAIPSCQAHDFGRTREGDPVTCFTLDAGSGASVRVLDYGAIIHSIRVPDRLGRFADVVLGYDSAGEYADDACYLGALVGRYAGRIAGAAFELDGERVALSANEGEGHLHGGRRGFGKVSWEARPFEGAGGVGVVLEHRSPHGDEGYPGTLQVRVTYTLSGDDVLGVDYRARCDRPTPLNLTQHAYFNLAGEGTGSVLGQLLTVSASAYTPLGAGHIPSGEIAPVAGSALDFRRPRAIGEHIGDPLLRRTRGYDHNYVLDGAPHALRPAATLRDAESGRVLRVSTTEPGMQLYTGNFLALRGKQGHAYGPHAGVCLETQHFPDSPNQPAFPSTILRPGEEFRSRTEFRFSVQ